MYQLNPLLEFTDRVTGKKYNIFQGQKALRERNAILNKARQKGYINARQQLVGAKTATLRDAAQKVMAEEQ